MTIHPILLLLFLSLCTSQTLNAFLRDKETILTDAYTELLALYNNRCDIDCVCSSAACKSDLSDVDFTCTKAYGLGAGCLNSTSCQDPRKLDMVESYIRTASADLSSKMKLDICWSKGMDEYWSETREEQEKLRWQYFGTPDGVHRIYPGNTQRNCNTYDNRQRPWWVAATSGPKDIVIVIDISTSMSAYARIDLAKDAVELILRTLTIADFFSVVIFSDSASTLGSSEELLFASTENRLAILEQVQNLIVTGSTNYEAAFNKAFDVLDNSLETTSGCSKMILFLTDGVPTVGEDDPTLLTELVARRNNFTGATVFSYSLGVGASETIPKQIACATDGIWTGIPDGGDLRSAMGAYFDYYAQLRTGTPKVAWTELYIDSSGAGEMTTGAIAVYDQTVSPPKLIGVLGIDILASDLREIEPDYERLITQLAILSSTCPSVTVDKCTLESLRRDVSLLAGEEVINMCAQNLTGCEARTTDACLFKTFPDFCNPIEQFTDQTFRESTCCGECDGDDDDDAANDDDDDDDKNVSLLLTGSAVLTLALFSSL